MAEPDGGDVAVKSKTYKSCWYAALLVIGLPFAALMVALILIVLQDQRSHAEAAAMIEKMEASGLSVTPEGRKRIYLEQTDDKNVEQWQRVFEQFSTDQFVSDAEKVPLFSVSVDANFPGPGEPWPHRVASQEFLAKYERLCSKVRRLSLEQIDPDAKFVRLPVDHDALNWFEAWNELRQAARLLALSGQVAIDNRESPNVRRNIVALIGCSKVASSNVNTISALINNSIYGLGIGVLEKALEEDVLSTSDIKILLPILTEEGKLAKNWRDMLVGETAFGLACFENPQLFEGPAVSMPFRGNDKLLYLKSMEALLEAPTDDIDAFYAVSDKTTQNIVDAGTPWEIFNSLYSSLSVASKQAITAVELRRATKSRLLVIAMRLRMYEEENGKMPAALSDLKRLDLTEMKPAGGLPFGYQVNDGEVILWWDHKFGPTPANPPDIGEESALQAYSQMRLKLSKQQEQN